MWVCPTCQKTFESAEQVAEHSLKCWREQNPYHISKPAPHSEDIVTKTINDDMKVFFAKFNMR